MERHAIGGSAANFPTLPHLILGQTLVDSGLFDRISWIPSGIRPDKHDFIAPEHRLAMTKMLVSHIVLPPGISFELIEDDIWGENTPSINWLEKLSKPGVSLTWYTGSDSIIPQERFNGKCEIEAVWHRGEELVENWSFLVVPRAHYQMPPWGHPIYDRFKNLIIMGKTLPDSSSTKGRKLAAAGLPVDHLTLPEIADYIKRNRLYQGGRS